MTLVINLFAGPGVGKSTVAAHLFYLMKKQGLNVELRQEWVKGWAWEGRSPKGSADNLYIFAKQLKSESQVYGKVDYIVTDSPLGLCPVYELAYRPGSTVVRDAYEAFMADQLLEGKVRYVNFHLQRQFPYVSAGRFETEEQAKRIDELCMSMHSGYVVKSAEEILSLLQNIGEIHPSSTEKC